MRKKQEAEVVLLVIMIFLLVFQDPLAVFWSPLSYIDEAIALVGLLYSFYGLFVGRQKALSGYTVFSMICLGLFAASGLLGNLLYRYQPWKAAVIDLYTNLKFFFAVNTGFAVLHILSWETVKKQANSCARMLSVCLFVVFLLDRVLQIYGGEIRYGIRSSVLFYSHPTYLAGALVFLLCLMAAFYEKKNCLFMVMNLIQIAFTLRSKAIVSTIVFTALWAFLVLWKQKIKRWHFILLAAAGIIVAWPQIDYYFIELANKSARSVLLITSLKIMWDYLPIGTGFGTYASNEAAKQYSPVYEKYGFQDNWELRNIADEANTQRLMRLYDIPVDKPYGGPYLNDSFWPIIFGQTGILGTGAYLAVMGSLAIRSWKLQSDSVHSFVVVLYIWFHLLICSIAEPAFNNPTAVPLALVMGMVICAAENKTAKGVREKRGTINHRL